MSREDLEDSLTNLDGNIEENIADLAENKAEDVRISLKSIVANVRSILSSTPVEGEYLKQNDLPDLEGDDGKSAYDIWLDLGNSGTEQDFIDSLKGPPGKDIVGPQGDSAYDVWLSNGNSGNEQDYLDSLEGQDGEKGSGFTGGSYEAATGKVTFTSVDGLGFETLDLRGADGTDGDSAFQSWLNSGNSGTETDFVNDLQGSKGDPGDTGTDGLGFTGGSYSTSTGAVTFTSDDSIGFSTDDLRGANGLSAYGIWLSNGNTGSEQDYLNSLVGNNGNTILNGARNPSSIDGLPGDFFINISSDFIFGPKPETGAWPAGIKITGEDGEEGPTAVSIDEGNSAVLGSDSLVYVPPSLDIETVSAIAAGSSLGVEQALLANDGQPGFTVQAVGYTNTGKVQGCSLGAGNVVEVYTNGNDFNSGNVLYREFMALGEPICFTGLTNGAIITASEGFYGFSECLNGSNESPMPLLSYGLSFKFSFFYMFRDSQSFNPGGTNSSQGWIHVVNGPLASVVSLKFGDESVVEGQENISLAPWQYYRFYSAGNVEYILDSTNPIMSCVNARMGPDPRFYDSRLVMPLANAIFSWPRSGNVSAPYEGTISPWYNRTGTSGELNSAGTVGNGPGVSPGFPVDWDSAPPVGTGASDQDYEANGFTGQYFVGLGCAYSGADSAGLEASPAIPKTAMSQIVAQPLYIKDNGDGGNSGVAIGSYYEGTAKIYAWDFATKTLNLAYTVPLTRGDTVPVITSKEDQLIPASGLVANENGSGAILLEGDLAAGIVIADVPITVVTQNGDNAYAQPIRSQNGTETTSLINDDDETLSLGITPESIRVEVREGEDGILYKRTIAAGGIETWVIA